jgi:hypothetical protein
VENDTENDLHASDLYRAKYRFSQKDDNYCSKLCEYINQ